ncbi:MAG: hypothetical protein CSB47_05635 [Proteobacteria bacterium]|nr:MAG: hypothetical protein CSB47_05635 [Pseudomonadota bacterium]
MTDVPQNTSPESSAATQFAYSAAGFNILLEPSIKTEIIEQRSVFPIPHAPEWCRGMISLRGKLIPVIDIHRLLGRTITDQPHWLLIIETTGLPPAAIHIDQLPVQQQIVAEELRPITEDDMPFWIKRVIDIAEQPVYEANHTELFNLLIAHDQQPQPNIQRATEQSDSSGIEA